jgi:hypothetical protein
MVISTKFAHPVKYSKMENKKEPEAESETENIVSMKVVVDDMIHQ